MSKTLARESIQLAHDTRPLERLHGELLPLSHQLAEASQFVAELGFLVRTGTQYAQNLGSPET